MTTKIILMLIFVAVPTLLGIACGTYREEGLARFDPAIGRFMSRLLIATLGLVLAWGCFGLWAVFLSRSPPAWVLVSGLAGVLFGCFFGLPIYVLEWLESRPKPRAKPTRRLASKGPLWDAELDR